MDAPENISDGREPVTRATTKSSPGDAQSMNHEDIHESHVRDAPGPSQETGDHEDSHARIGSADIGEPSQEPKPPSTTQLDQTHTLSSMGDTVAIHDTETSATTSNSPNLGKKPGHNRPPLTAFWVWEIHCCFLSTLGLVTISVLLAIYKDRSVSDWSLAISINSLISVFSAVIKACSMMGVSEGISQMKWLWYVGDHRPLSHFEDFDSASRGPLGALKLLARRRPHHIANLGALVTVLMVAADPFFQQLIHYDSCLLPTTAPAYISRTNNYTVGGYQTQLLFAEPDPAMANAVYSGALEPPSAEAGVVAYDCPTGNCTFPGFDGNVGSFSSLAMCSHCEDLSHRIQVNGSSPSFYIPSWWSEPVLQIGEILKWNNLPFQMAEASKVPANNSNFDEVINLQFLMKVLDDTGTCKISNTTHCPKHPWAVGCSLYPCLKTYNAKVQGSILSETMISSVPLRKTNASSVEVTVSPNMAWSLATEEIVSGGQRRQCLKADKPGKDATVAISSNQTLQIGQDPTDVKTKWYEADCVWVLGTTSGLAVNQILSHMFDASLLGSVTDNTMSVQGDTWLKRFYRNGTVDLNSAKQYFEGIASTLTGLMRQHGDTPASGYAMGTQLAVETCIHVQWPWLLFPAALNAMAVTTLVGTLGRSAKTKTWKGAWRSSSLAAMFQRVNVTGGEANTTSSGGLHASRDQIEETAKTIEVSMVEGYLGRKRPE
ncbi:uncharacterized protein PG986_008904 [Apiospora aurea]|uniref:Uncharacterized protein n=1 Tax=Apiospora aurea TaxID=335848 RepID=A0ABR1Q677_9PEZI